MIHNPISAKQIALISKLLDERQFDQADADKVSEYVRDETYGPRMIDSHIDLNDLGALTSFEAHVLIRHLLIAPGKDGRDVYCGDGQ